MGKPIKIYAEHVEQEALDQFESAMGQDFAVKGALMPDAHTGYSLPIGAVVATDGVIVPSWIGYDIGCGMCAVPTTFDHDDVMEYSKDIFELIYEYVPVGFTVNEHPVPSNLNVGGLSDIGRSAFEKRGGFSHLGTLGGGNHFIEIGYDEDNAVWVTIHSGSRGIGHGIATEYMRMASGDGKVREGHFGFGVDSENGKKYINDMSWALEFALENRLLIASRVGAAMSSIIDGEIDIRSRINANHNHAELRDGLWIHRKGATQAENGMMGVIPGNMRDGSFIVCGKGNPESLYSSSHGAGRVMGRKQAKRELSMDNFKFQMIGVVAKVEAETLDESPMAYKDILEVMRLQSDLVELVHYVLPMINIKA
ncbi:MAG: RtcB family protein [Desulfobacterales bacterium]|nr:RtcB family protein [Desulfobacterales bacterium]